MQDARRAAARYLAVADRLLPGRITGCYLVGSAALDAWRPLISDIDFVAVVGGSCGDREIRRLRVLHLAGNLGAARNAVAHRRPAIPGTMNGVFVAADEVAKPVTSIRPIAAHTGRRFRRDRAFDVNPVTWQVLAEHGITLRGPAPDSLHLDPEPHRLRDWTLGQLRNHWRPYAEQVRSARRISAKRLLGPPRMHYTVRTGRVISKEAAGEYALDTFDRCWHPVILAALSLRDGTPIPTSPRDAAEFMLHVIDDVEP